MKKKRIIVGALLLSLIVTIVLKPSDEKIRKEVANEMHSFISPRMPGREAAVNKMIETATQKGLAIEDKLLYKEVYMVYGTERKKAGWAAWGRVKFNIKNGL